MNERPLILSKEKVKPQLDSLIRLKLKIVVSSWKL